MFQFLTLWLHAQKQALTHTLQVFQCQPWMHGMTTLVVAVTLTLPLLFWMVMHHAKQLTANWGETARIVLYLKTSITETEAQQFSKTLMQDTGIERVMLISPEQGLQQLSATEGMRDIARFLPENPLPAALEIVPVQILRNNPEALEAFYQRLKALAEVDLAKLDMDWVKKIHTMLAVSARLSTCLLCLLGIAIVFIVSNTLKLALSHRQQEIQILKLVGATDAYIMRPMLYQGLCYGLFGALGGCIFAIALTQGFIILFNSLVFDYKISFLSNFIPISKILILFLFAGILGWVGAFLSVKRQLILVEPR